MGQTSTVCVAELRAQDRMENPPPLSEGADKNGAPGLYAAAAVAGYLMGKFASHAGWALAGEIQISLLSTIVGSLALTLRPDQMSL